MASKEDVEKICDEVYEKLNRLLGRVAPTWMRGLAEGVAKASEEIKSMGPAEEGREL